MLEEGGVGYVFGYEGYDEEDAEDQGDGGEELAGMGDHLAYKN